MAGEDSARELANPLVASSSQPAGAFQHLHLCILMYMLSHVCAYRASGDLFPRVCSKPRVAGRETPPRGLSFETVASEPAEKTQATPKKKTRVTPKKKTQVTPLPGEIVTRFGAYRGLQVGPKKCQAAPEKNKSQAKHARGAHPKVGYGAPQKAPTAGYRGPCAGGASNQSCSRLASCLKGSWGDDAWVNMFGLIGSPQESITPKKPATICSPGFEYISEIVRPSRCRRTCWSK